MAHDPRDVKLDITSTDVPSQPSGAPSPAGARPFLSVQFACCSVYQRVYRDPDGTQYRGRCPKCGKTVTFAVGEGGTSSRFFVVR
jgi:hypothetical protein